MIGYLKGTVLVKKKQEVWLGVGGVGYRIKVGERVFQGLHTDAEKELFIHTAVREDAITLYGFADLQELQMFELLLTVSGVGPKTALVIVGTQTVERVEAAVATADVEFFRRVPGIGKKSSQRIIVDLKGKLPSLKELDLTEGEAEDEVVTALMQFGFKRNEVYPVLKDLNGLSEAEKLREGLKRLGRK